MKIKFAKHDKRSDLRKEYDNAVLLLKTVPTDSELYSVQLKNVERLHKLLMEEEDRKLKVTPDAILTGGVQLVLSAMIMKHEELHHITTKAFTFLTKGRLR